MHRASSACQRLVRQYATGEPTRWAAILLVKQGAAMRQSVRQELMAELLCFTEATGWVHESQVFARIKSNTGSHVWRDDERVSDAALNAAFQRHVEAYLDSHPDMPPELADAVDDFEDAPSVDRLVEVVKRIWILNS